MLQRQKRLEKWAARKAEEFEKAGDLKAALTFFNMASGMEVIAYKKRLKEGYVPKSLLERLSVAAGSTIPSKGTYSKGIERLEQALKRVSRR